MASSVSVVLPTYDERDNIQRLIPEIEAAFHHRSLEILVVDDSSPDGTGDAAEELGRRYGNIRVIRRPRRAGLGSAIRRGYDEARHEVLVSCDTDGSFSAPDLLRLTETLDQGFDLVLGSRHASGGRYETPRWSIWVKYGVSWLGNRVLRYATGLPLHDFSSNCRAIRRATWKAIQTTEQTNTLLLEVILRVAGARGRITEIPVAFVDRQHGVSKLNLWVEIPRFFTVALRHLSDHWNRQRS